MVLLFSLLPPLFITDSREFDAHHIGHVGPVRGSALPAPREKIGELLRVLRPPDVHRRNLGHEILKQRLKRLVEMRQRDGKARSDLG